MRIHGFIAGKPEPEPSARCRPAPHERVNEWYAMIRTYMQLLTRALPINYISGSRTLGTINLCAIVPARRLCGS
jgi:hypothetical protein